MPPAGAGLPGPPEGGAEAGATGVPQGRAQAQGGVASLSGAAVTAPPPAPPPRESLGPPPEASTAPRLTTVPRRQLRIVMAGALLAMVLAALDQNIVNAALPRMAGDLGGLAHLSWVVTAFM